MTATVCNCITDHVTKDFQLNISVLESLYLENGLPDDVFVFVLVGLIE